MARVIFNDSLLAHTDGEREIVTEVKIYRDLVKELIARWPAIAESLERTAVAIDGQIYQDAFLEEIGADSEVFFMSRIEGG